MSYSAVNSDSEEFFIDSANRVAFRKQATEPQTEGQADDNRRTHARRNNDD